MKHTSASPLTLRVSFTSGEKDDGIRFHLHCPDLDIDAGPFPFTSPLDDKVRSELRWYLENYPRWPAGPSVDRAARIEARMEGWGRALFHFPLRQLR